MKSNFFDYGFTCQFFHKWEMSDIHDTGTTLKLLRKWLHIIHGGNPTYRKHAFCRLQGRSKKVCSLLSPFLTTMLKKEDTGIAYSAIIGMSYRVSSFLDLSMEYNYFGLEDLDFDDEDGRPVETRYESHNINVGMRFQF